MKCMHGIETAWDSNKPLHKDESSEFGQIFLLSQLYLLNSYGME